MSERQQDLRVLVVDDDFMIGRIHREFVQRMEGFVVVGEARSGQEALDEALRLHPDIVLLDIYLPDLSGLDVLERLRASEGGRHIDVIMITAARDAETVSQALRFGALHYLIKPFKFEDLRARLQQAATTRRSLTTHSDEPQLGQEDVDRVFGPAATAVHPERLPKGLSVPTMQLVVDHLEGQETDESAAEIGEQVGLSRVSARRYLEHLVATEKVIVSLRYGEAGRPERRYRWQAR